MNVWLSFELGTRVRSFRSNFECSGRPGLVSTLTREPLLPRSTLVRDVRGDVRSKMMAVGSRFAASVRPAVSGAARRTFASNAKRPASSPLDDVQPHCRAGVLSAVARDGSGFPSYLILKETSPLLRFVDERPFVRHRHTSGRCLRLVRSAASRFRLVHPSRSGLRRRASGSRFELCSLRRRFVWKNSLNCRPPRHVYDYNTIPIVGSFSRSELLRKDCNFYFYALMCS